MSGTRPKWCLDCSCRPIASSPAITGKPGESQFCSGRVPEMLVTERGGVRHENDAHFCIKSPRGIVMTEVNENDFALFARLSMRALVDYHKNYGFNARWFTGRDSWRPERTEEAR